MPRRIRTAGQEAASGGLGDGARELGGNGGGDGARAHLLAPRDKLKQRDVNLCDVIRHLSFGLSARRALHTALYQLDVG